MANKSIVMTDDFETVVDVYRRRGKAYFKIEIPLTMRLVPEEEWEEFIKQAKDMEKEEDSTQQSDSRREFLERIIVSVDTDIQTKKGDGESVLQAGSQEAKDYVIRDPWSSRAIFADYAKSLSKNTFQNKS